MIRRLDQVGAMPVALAALLALAAGAAVASPGGAVVVGGSSALLAAIAAVGGFRRHSAAHLHGEVPLLRVVVGGTFAGLAAYTVAFDYLNDSLRLAIAGALAVFMVLIAVYAILGLPRGARPTGVLIAFAVILGLTVLGALIGLHPLRATDVFRQSFPLLLAVGLVYRPDVIPVRVLAIGSAGIIAIGTLISFSHGKQFLFDATRLSPFTGGALDGIHSSSLTLGCCIVILNELRRLGRVRTSVALVLSAVAVVDVIELKVATGAVLIIVYFTVRQLVDARVTARRMLALLAAGCIAVLGVQVRVQEKISQRFGQHSTSADSLTSGRLQSWQQRSQLLDQRGATLILLGSGFGSDRISLDVWNDNPLDSHNDFLTILIEEGVLGLAGYALVLGAAARRGGRAALPIFAALIVTSATSNAMFARPMVSPLLWFGAGLAVSVTLRAASGDVAEHGARLAA